MKLLIRRDHKSGLMGGASYSLSVRAELTPEELELVRHNGLSSEILYFHDKDAGASRSVWASSMKAAGGLSGAIVSLMRDTKLTVATLTQGTTFKCKNVGELLGVEGEVREAAKMLKAYLDAAKHFGGEELIDVDQLLHADS